MQFVNDLDEDQQLRDRLLEEIEMDRDGPRFWSRWPASRSNELDPECLMKAWRSHLTFLGSLALSP
jgi:hypothetical protein